MQRDASAQVRTPTRRERPGQRGGVEDFARITSGIYADCLGSWKELYGAVPRERGLRLRQGLTLDDLANARSAVNDGVTLRAIGAPASGVVGDTHRRSLTGTVTLAVIHAFLEPEEGATACPWNRPSRRASAGGARAYACPAPGGSPDGRRRAGAHPRAAHGGHMHMAGARGRRRS